MYVTAIIFSRNTTPRGCLQIDSRNTNSSMSRAVLQLFAHVMSDDAGELSHHRKKRQLSSATLPNVATEDDRLRTILSLVGGHMQNCRMEGIEKSWPGSSEHAKIRSGCIYSTSCSLLSA